MARPSTTARGLLVGGVEIENARQSAYSRQFDNIEWPAAWPHTAADLTPEDAGRDGLFYLLPRFGQHAADGARTNLEGYYGDVFAAQSARLSSSGIASDAASAGGTRDGGLAVLDLCASFTSHYPPGAAERYFARCAVLGLNGLELAANKGASEWKVHNLNEKPAMPFYETGAFDVVTCSLSADYLTSPREVFEEIFRVLKPGGLACMAFTNRCFPNKVVPKWLAPFEDAAHIRHIGSYFHFTGPWADLAVADVTPPGFGTDPMYVVQARKPPPSPPA